MSGGLDLDGSTMGRHVRRTPGGVSGGVPGGGAGRRLGRVVRRGGRSHGRVLPRDAFEDVADPALLLLRRVGEQQQVFGSGHVVVHCGEKIWRGGERQVETRRGTFSEYSGFLPLNSPFQGW